MVGRGIGGQVGGLRDDLGNGVTWYGTVRAINPSSLKDHRQTWKLADATINALPKARSMRPRATPLVQVKFIFAVKIAVCESLQRQHTAFLTVNLTLTPDRLRIE